MELVSLTSWRVANRRDGGVGSPWESERFRTRGRDNIGGSGSDDGDGDRFDTTSADAGSSNARIGVGGFECGESGGRCDRLFVGLG